MVTTGFSRIHVAKYSADAAGKVTYSDCRELARARSMDLSIETSSDSKFYANNEVAEEETAAFKSGTAKLGVDGLSAEEEAFILGIQERTVTVGDEEVPIVGFGKSMNPPYLGIGAVKRMKLKGVESFRPVILTRAKFEIPPDAAQTGEESTNWQTQDLSASLSRDESEYREWKIIPKENFDTEEKAVAFVRAFLGGVAQ